MLHYVSNHAIAALKEGRTWTGARDKVRCINKETNTWVWYYHDNPIATFNKSTGVMLAGFCGWFTKTTTLRLKLLGEAMGVNLPKAWQGEIEVKEYPKCETCGEVLLKGTICPACEYKKAYPKGGRDQVSLLHKEDLNGMWYFASGGFCVVQYYEGLDSFYCIINADLSLQTGFAESGLKNFLRRNFAGREKIEGAA